MLKKRRKDDMEGRKIWREGREEGRKIWKAGRYGR